MFVEPLKDKTTTSAVKGFERILQRTELRPIRVQSDHGKEFDSNIFRKFMKNNDIAFNTTNNPDIKASICERSIRTLKGHIYKFLTYNDTFRFIDNLQDFVLAYNNTYHRTIKMSPSSVNETNILQVYKNTRRTQENDCKKKRRKRKPKFCVGDYVRITKEKNVFAKGYTKNYTEETFKIKTVIRRTPVVYRLIDLSGEEITGTFYEQELQRISFDESAPKVVYKIIKQRGTGKNLQYFVRYRNYPPSFDTWINASSLTLPK